MTDQESCQICQREGREQHAIDERDLLINHQFSTDGQMTPTDRSLPRRPPPARPTMVIANAVDMELREVLLRKGVISASDFGPLSGVEASASGDLRTGEKAKPRGGMRAAARRAVEKIQRDE